MIEDTVKQTRCTTCDADHEYKEARVPTRRRAERGHALSSADSVEAGLVKSAPDQADSDAGEGGAEFDAPPVSDHEVASPVAALGADTPPPGADAPPPDPDAPLDTPATEDDGPVHRRLIRATLPRPEGQAPERKEPEFTIRQPLGRGPREVNGNRVGYRPQGSGRRGRHGEGGGPSRFGGHRQGGSGSRFGSSPSGAPSGDRQARHGQGGQGQQGRGPQPGGPRRRRGR
jgi:hypothetical protein